MRKEGRKAAVSFCLKLLLLVLSDVDLEEAKVK